jgi:hypothetical protein
MATTEALAAEALSAMDSISIMLDGEVAQGMAALTEGAIYNSAMQRTLYTRCNFIVNHYHFNHLYQKYCKKY